MGAAEADRTPDEFAKLVFDHPEVASVRVLVARREQPGMNCVFCEDKKEPCEWTLAWVDQDGTKNLRAFHDRHFKETMV